MEGDIFKAFCHYVDDRIFSKENMGSYVALVVDQSFVDDFCRENHTTEDALMSSVRSILWRYRHDDLTHDDLTIKGIVAIQLFAASKRANADELTVKNYRGRLSQVVHWDINDMNQWMATYQDSIWLSLFKWCDNHYYKIIKTEKRTGPYCYVQYPVTQALRIFNEEDLFYIARAFVDKHLYPGEDISEMDFWRIISKHAIKRYFGTRHASDVVDYSVSDDDYYSQIYNYYLRWNGKYKIREKIVKTDPALSEVFAYLTDDFITLELRDEHLKLLHSFSSNQMEYANIQKLFPFKREGLLLFKRDDVYENRWQEVRYIDADETSYSKESGNYGVVVCFKNAASFKWEYKLKLCEVLYENRFVVIYKLFRRISTEEFFTEKRPYELYGGLKIGRNTYLKGATPILRLIKPSMVWIDGKAVNAKAIHGDFSLNHLETGNHYVKLINIKKIRIDVVDTSTNIGEWQNSYNKWLIGKKPPSWYSTKSENGIVGLDFSSICDNESSLDESVTKRWARALAFDEYHSNENNIAIILTRS